MIDRPELTVYDPSDSSYFRFRQPDSVLVVPAAGRSPHCAGREPSLSSDPFVALNEFFDAFDTGVVAGWIQYDFARFNPLYSFRTNYPGVDRGPLVVLAHYPGSRQQYRTKDLPTGSLTLGELTPGQDRSTYANAIRNIQTLIKHGYVYQINYSQEFTAPIRGDLLNLLGRLDDSVLPPHSAHGRMGDYEFLSLSPERFFQVDDHRIITEPIKGTRPRRGNGTEDGELKQELKGSTKDRAEHMMIVDLERNDLNQVCEPGTVRVPSLARAETFPTVHHLVSTVEGELSSDVGFGDLIEKLFPGGSITGCPKRIAIRTIDALEQRPRGLYTGTIGYWDLDNNLADWNIAIRTLQRYRDRAWWDSGGGIVIDSSPEEEYSESLDKVELIKRIKRTTTATQQSRTEEPTAS